MSKIKTKTKTLIHNPPILRACWKTFL